MDESGIEETLHRDYARAERGKRVIVDIQGKKAKRTSIIAAYLPHTKEIIAPFVFEGYTDSKRFNGWLQKCLLPVLHKGQTVVMDNAPFHKSKKTRELIESVGCKLLYQPAYSPDLNPIENQWNTLKEIYKAFKKRGYLHDDALNAAFGFI